ncbi:TPM domain-containing protein [Dokdonia sp. Hel_I_53]|uniref:TPM domain-containing protein n=1 Tax=Dokdonia sp. Hel_I_53 TaxID=1566287 RepID=UPI001199A92A|nr:TPM domain-containing protein [Dokdonia sp. Hel_I_53]TVZ52210.1 TLP18.3/Psb32/MOLO-1 phosphatase superfamily protein [Dokdonia sp. Hel_I_53]
MASTVEDFLTKEDEQAIVAAIRHSETQTSGEIRVHLEHHANKDALLRAQELFHFLKMDNTKDENGVLIYVAVDDHKLAICGDAGINRKVPSDFWESTMKMMLVYFKKGDFRDGLIAGVASAGDKLAAFFPWQHGDINELPDEITTS